LPAPADREQGQFYRNCEEASMGEMRLGVISKRMKSSAGSEITEEITENE
jgi:hypothetical protein